MIGHQLPAAMDSDAVEAALALMPEDEGWELVEGRVCVLALSALGVTIPLAEIYRDVLSA